MEKNSLRYFANRNIRGSSGERLENRKGLTIIEAQLAEISIISSRLAVDFHRLESVN
jgi:hypothetical protein